MRVHVVNFLRPDPEYAGRTLDYLVGLARQVEGRDAHSPRMPGPPGPAGLRPPYSFPPP